MNSAHQAVLETQQLGRAAQLGATCGALQRRVGPAVARGACRTRLLVVCSASNTLLELDLATGARPQGVCPQTSMRYTSCCMWWSRTAHAPLDGVPGRTLLLLKPASGPQCLASSRLLKMCLLCNEQARLLAAAVMCCPRWPGSVLTPVSLSGCAQRLSFSLHTRQASAHDCGALPILRTACSRTQRPCRERYMDAPHTSRPRAQRTHAAHCAAAAGAVVRSVRLTQPRRRRSGPGGPVTAEERAAAAQDSKRECWPTCIAISPYDGHVYVCQYKARGAAARGCTASGASAAAQTGWCQHVHVCRRRCWAGGLRVVTGRRGAGSLGFARTSRGGFARGPVRAASRGAPPASNCRM